MDGIACLDRSRFCQMVDSPAVASLGFTRQPPGVGRRLLLAVVCSNWLLFGASCLAEEPGSTGQVASSSPLASRDVTVLAVVNGQEINRADVQCYMALRQMAEAGGAELERLALQKVIDRALIEAFLTTRKVVADVGLVEERLLQAETLSGARGRPAAEIYAELGLTREHLQRGLALELAWDRFALETISEQQLADFFAAHQAELDGTQRRVSQIFRAVPKDGADRDALLQKERAVLQDVRTQILAGQQTFSAAAKALSQAPTGKKGGEVGWISQRGKLPAAVGDAAFALSAGELSEPVESPLGVHLVQVHEVQPGQLNLEDVRPVIFARLKDQLWAETLAPLRRAAQIELNSR